MIQRVKSGRERGERGRGQQGASREDDMCARVVQN